MIEEPTLCIRVQLPDGPSHIGANCHEYAKEIVGNGGKVLDSKWSHPASKWREVGGWGRPHLTDRQRGYVDACRDLGDDTVRKLVEIIDSMTRGGGQ